MANQSKTEGTITPWNPITGCTPASPGCAHCYAERMAHRLQAMGNEKYRQGFKVTVHPDLFDLPLRWRKPKRIFVNSMGDLFHEEVPLADIQTVFRVMQFAHWHTFQVLTKRADRLLELAGDLPWPENVWMGVTVERQDYAWRIDRLRSVPAAVRFLSCEPLLGPLELDLRDIHWVNAGGESGPGARPMKEEWARSLRDQCQTAGVLFYLKQLGGAVNKRAKEEALLDGELWRELPARFSVSDRTLL